MVRRKNILKKPDFLNETPSISWFPGHMKRTSDLIRVLSEKTDVVAEILDARIPVSSRNPLIEKLTPKLPRLIILNKTDLADPYRTSLWEKFFRNKNCEVLSLSSYLGLGKGKKIQKKVEDKLRDLLPNYFSFTVLICGIPNVGKSTFINLISGNKKTKVGNRPGVTMNKQVIRLGEEEGENWSMIDLPGLHKTKLSPDESFYLALCGTIKEGIYNESELASRFLKEIIFQQNSIEVLIRNFSLDSIANRNNQDEMYWLEQIARRRGYLIRKGENYFQKAAAAVIRDFQKGKLGRITLEIPSYDTKLE